MITIDNVGHCLDQGNLYVLMRSSRWWRARRNGATQRWARTPNRIRVPIKFGMRGYSAITETCFVSGVLDSRFYRHVDDVPVDRRPA